MKKILIILIMMMILVSPLKAEPGDIEITIVIPVAFIDDFRSWFLRDKPIPLMDNPAYLDDPNQPAMVDAFMEKVWFKKVIRKYVFKVLKKGKILLNKDAIVVDPNMIKE